MSNNDCHMSLVEFPERCAVPFGEVERVHGVQNSTIVLAHYRYESKSGVEGNCPGIALQNNRVR